MLLPAAGRRPLVAVCCLLAACNGQKQVADAARQYTNRICAQSGDDPIIAAALTGFLNRSDPEPAFLLYIPSTDSTPPPAAVQAMQERRTTYMYSTDPAQQAIVEKRITSYGNYDAFVVAYHGLSKTDPLHPVVTFSGHYVTGTSVRGRPLGPFQIAPQCDSTGEWQTPAPAPITRPKDKGPASASASTPRAG